MNTRGHPCTLRIEFEVSLVSIKNIPIDRLEVRAQSIGHVQVRKTTAILNSCYIENNREKLSLTINQVV